jgi:hypothetical protein
MSRASDTFAQSILDAENLLKKFNTLNSKPPPPELEVLKRAGLVMAMLAANGISPIRPLVLAAPQGLPWQPNARDDLHASCPAANLRGPALQPRHR